MNQTLDALWQEFDKALPEAQNTKDLEQLRIKFLGKKGAMTQLMKELGQLPPQDKPAFGAKINVLKEKINQALEEAIQKSASQEQNAQIAAERIDVTLPGTLPLPGGMHPVARVAQEIASIFLSMGFFMADGPEIEQEFYNFEALNIPTYHPARDMQDTFYVENGKVLRTQTSPVQIRIMERIKPPFKMIALGKVFRRDSDITHSPMFHQMEGLVVGEGVKMSDLKGTLLMFSERMFGKRPFRFRPSYFPFTEPSAEMDIQCVFCSGKGCKVCKFSGWMEILGCGMVNPKVFNGVNYDSEKYTGFAFGMGIERQAMQRYGINDIRVLFNSDVRFLRQF